jgi:hypothetical protein
LICLQSVRVHSVCEFALEFVVIDPEIAACVGDKLDSVVAIVGIDNLPLGPVRPCELVSTLELGERAH